MNTIRDPAPGDAARLAAGDVVARLAGREVAVVYGYTEVLAALEADVPVEVVYVRDGTERATTVTPEAR